MMEKCFVDSVCPPPRIQQAAVEIGRWFANNNIKHWELAHCASRVSLEQLRQRVAELEKERDDWKDEALGSRITVETLKAERDAALHSLENCRLLAARHRKYEWAHHILRFCIEGGVEGSPIRDIDIQADQIATLKSALREAKEDIEAFGNHDWDCKFVISNFSEKCTCWHSKSIATINAALGEEK